MLPCLRFAVQSGTCVACAMLPRVIACYINVGVAGWQAGFEGLRLPCRAVRLTRCKSAHIAPAAEIVVQAVGVLHLPPPLPPPLCSRPGLHKEHQLRHGEIFPNLLFGVPNALPVRPV